MFYERKYYLSLTTINYSNINIANKTSLVYLQHMTVQTCTSIMLQLIVMLSALSPKQLSLLFRQNLRFFFLKHLRMYSICILTLSLLFDVAHSEGHDVLLVTLILNPLCLCHHGNHFLPLHDLHIIHAACLTHLLSEIYIYCTHNSTHFT